MAQAMTGLFGPSADEVRLAIEQQGQQQDMQWANVDPLRSGQVLGAQAGRMLGNVAEGLGGYQDPRVQSAQLMQEAAQEVDSHGFSLLEDPQKYYKAAYASLMKRGLTAEAAHVRDLALNESATQSKINLQNAQAEAELASIGKGTWDKLDKDGRFLINTKNGTIKKNEEYTGSTTYKEGLIFNMGPEGIEPGGPGTITVDLNTDEGIKQFNEAKQKGLVRYGNPTTPNNVRVSVDNATRKSFGENFGEAAAKEQYGIYVTARDAPIAVSKAQSIIEALDDPNLIVGPGADARLAIAKTLNLTGADNEESISNTQSLVSDLADATLAAIGTSGLGTGQGFTEKDKQMLQDARAGRIPMTKETLAHVSRKAIEAQRWSVIKWNEQLANYDQETKQILRQSGVNTDPKPVPIVPKAKKYKTKEQIIQNTPEGWRPEVWNSLSDDKKAEINRLMQNGK
jgi:hypothetical protein